MKKLLLYLGLIVSCVTFVQCDDWTDPEVESGLSKEDFMEQDTKKVEAYYAALRDYKKSDHSVCFGWYASWQPTATTSIAGTAYMSSLPDSMDIVSLWESGWSTAFWLDMNDMKRKDLDYARKNKGLKVVYCHMLGDIGAEITPQYVQSASVEEPAVINGVEYTSPATANAAFWGYDGGTNEDWEAACRKFAQAFTDSIIKYDYDGIDLDYEPNYGHTGNLASYPQRMHWFLDELSKAFGPVSGSERLLIVDGEPQTLNAESGPLLDYYIIQAYNCSGDANLDSRFSGLVNKFGQVEDVETIARKTIWTENFEDVSLRAGGANFTKRDGTRTKSLRGMAEWRPRDYPDVRIGGVGAFKFALSYNMHSTPYFYMREAIQAMNPAGIENQH